MILNPYAPANGYNDLLRREGAAVREALKRGVFAEDLLTLVSADVSPMQSVPFHFDNTVLTSALLNGSENVILDFTFPRGFDGVITGLVWNYIGNLAGGGQVDGDGQLIWSLLIDNRPSPGYANIVEQFGSPIQARPVSRGIPVFSGQRVEVNLSFTKTVITVGVTRMLAAVQGVRFPTNRSEIDRRRKFVH
jgi:hypothetical protein